MSVFATVGTTRFDALVEALATTEVPLPFPPPPPSVTGSFKLR